MHRHCNVVRAVLTTLQPASPLQLEWMSGSVVLPCTDMEPCICASAKQVLELVKDRVRAVIAIEGDISAVCTCIYSLQAGWGVRENWLSNRLSDRRQMASVDHLSALPHEAQDYACRRRNEDASQWLL